MAFFIPRNNAWFSFWVAVSPVYRYALTIMTVLGVVGAWYGLVYRTTETRIGACSSYLTSAEQRRTQLRTAQQKQKHLQQELLTAQHTFEQAVPTTDQFAEQIAVLIRQANTSGINFDACTFCDEDDQHWCAKQSTSCSFSGNLYQLLHFFDAVRSSKKMVQCTKLSMNTSDENQFTVQCALDFFSVKDK